MYAMRCPEFVIALELLVNLCVSYKVAWLQQLQQLQGCVVAQLIESARCD